MVFATLMPSEGKIFFVASKIYVTEFYAGTTFVYKIACYETSHLLQNHSYACNL